MWERRAVAFRRVYKRPFKIYFLIFVLFFCVRWTKGAVFLDAYSFLTRSLGFGIEQRESLKNSELLEQKIRVNLLEKDNQRLRKMLSLKSLSEKDKIPAAVISRNANGWWQQLELNKGKNQGINIGDAVIAPGGLVGIIYSVTPISSRVRLLTSPGSRVGVWVERIQAHGILIGMGTNRTKLTLLDKASKANLGDVVSTSPASTLLPPNLPVGVIKSLDNEALPVPFGIVQLIAAPEAIDWVQVLKN